MRDVLPIGKTITEKPAHGDGRGPTSALEPLRCRTCDAKLTTVAIYEAQRDVVTDELTDTLAVEAEVVCPNGCEDCV